MCKHGKSKWVWLLRRSGMSFGIKQNEYMCVIELSFYSLKLFIDCKFLLAEHIKLTLKPILTVLDASQHRYIYSLCLVLFQNSDIPAGRPERFEPLFGVALAFDPVSLILGCRDSTLNPGSGSLYDILTFAARKNIFLSWIRDKPPSKISWHKLVIRFFFFRKPNLFPSVYKGTIVLYLDPLLYCRIYTKQHCDRLSMNVCILTYLLHLVLTVQIYVVLSPDLYFCFELFKKEIKKKNKFYIFIKTTNNQ
ncbi:hypothetical protein XENOCAPTIV_011970 [Xenoophorus captivus]|uniref:Uncharacterized protein n=1 Tax=Xenoophorus captivus TaxID=1517983 RepID=A0ABV0Q9H6_9TELE